MSSIPMVLYHAGCADGFGAAWAAWKKLGNEAVYIPVQYGQPYPPEIDSGVREVFIVDFSYPADVLERIASSVERLTILDHHQTAEQPLKDFQAVAHTGYVDVRFDNTKSGAILAWEYFHLGEPLPYLLLLVQDRDLWKWELPMSREASAAIATYPFDFQKWDCLLWAATDGSLVREGSAVLRYQAEQVKRHTANATINSVAGYQVPTVNATTLMSEIGEALCGKFPEAPFAATWLEKDGKRIFSLRSRNGFDVGAVAKSQGGGGHQAAAGFTVDL